MQVGDIAGKKEGSNLAEQISRCVYISVSGNRDKSRNTRLPTFDRAIFLVAKTVDKAPIRYRFPIKYKTDLSARYYPRRELYRARRIHSAIENCR